VTDCRRVCGSTPSSHHDTHDSTVTMDASGQRGVMFANTVNLLLFVPVTSREKKLVYMIYNVCNKFPALGIVIFRDTAEIFPLSTLPGFCRQTRCKVCVCLECVHVGVYIHMCIYSSTHTHAKIRKCTYFLGGMFCPH